MGSKTSQALANSAKEKSASAYLSSGHKRIDRRRFLMGGASAAGAAVAMARVVLELVVPPDNVSIQIEASRAIRTVVNEERFPVGQRRGAPPPGVC